ncbi:SusC/RagA family TonB-linked outer membrane protein [Chitinophaga eiseniae]|uniref:SusC/RagA family TonB-linked outer membrane protein n=1 Tax=Chitinophaga eiseniae TaxID=634771 RepID=A0A847SNY3_9BACT|nr:SusC/RagA family TonB-linked outer membrane protein [Chitinophaga eiseniae]NLR81553.1 SusC/RagA family TonB-linked outer membrane protein [Chitinophaga eiseniae]
MKMTTWLILVTCLHVSARSFSQQVTLSVKNMPLQKVFAEIILQSGATIVYNESVLKNTVPVTLHVNNANVETVLEQCLQHQPVTFTVSNGVFVIRPISPPATVPPPTDTIGKISGAVRSADGMPLPGATILVKGTSRGNATNAAGLFTVAANPGEILIFTYTGYDKQELPAHPGMQVILKTGSSQLDQVVVVGYSDKKKSELTSAVTVVNAAKLKDVTTNDVGTMLQGKVSGLQVVSSSGVPGAAAEIRLRGISSVNASQSPLVVVDGIIGGNYDPNDIESVTVLKDAGATAMYGSQANAGVIIITTKRAVSGKTQFQAKITTGFRTPDFGTMDMMNGSELYERQKEYYRDYIPGATNNSYKIDLLKFYNERPLSLRNQNYNWLTDMFRRAPMQNIYLSAAGKTEKADYYLGLSYYNEKGTFMNTNYQRVNLRANSTYHFSPRISLTNNINLSGSFGKTYDYNDMYYAFLNMPWDNPYDSMGKPLYVDGNAAFKWWSRDKVNPIHTINNSEHPYKNFDVNYDMGLNIGITNWLSFVSTNRLSLGYNKNKTWYSPLVAGQYHATGYLSELSTLNYGYVSNNLLKVDFHRGDHHISGLAGVAFEGSNTDVMGASGKGLPVGLKVLNTVANNQQVSGSLNEAIIQSFISQVNYSFQDKYFLTGSFRVDGSSNFPSGNRYASFPSVSAAWLMSNEDFLRDNHIFTNVKLRASYGVTGTQDIGSSRYLALFSLASQYNGQSAATPSQLPSPDLTWESKYQWNGGVDISLFKRIDLSVDVYNNVTKNLLLQVSQPLSVGFETKWQNVGELVNNGVELGLSSVNIRSGKFQWSTDFNINFNTNKLQKFPANIINTQSTWSISQIYRNGGNLYEFYMPKWLGVDKQTGAPLWEVVNKDGTTKATSDYASATYQEVGSALPKFQGGMTNTFTYNGISLGVNIYFLSGNKVYSNNLRFVENDGNEPYYNQVNLPKGSSTWAKPGDDATEPSPQNSANSTQTSTRFLKDGSFLALRNISLSYELPHALVTRMKLNGITVGFTADNVHTFTNFLGQDPQTTITPGSQVMPGVSDFKYPNNRQYLFNINFRF